MNFQRNMTEIKRKDALLATKQVVEAICKNGSKVLGHATIEVNPFDPISGMPKETVTAVVIYLD